MKKIILASASPRRKGILEKLNVKFEVIDSHVDELIEEKNYNEKGVEHTPYEWVKAISAIKARTVAEKVSNNSVIIGVDTIVTDLGKIVHRPINSQEAITMLKGLSGRKHTVYTGMTLVFKEDDGTVTEETFVDATDVVMRNITEDEIRKYVGTEEPYDKAGGYAIQGKGAFLVDHIYGDFYTVVGLPISVLYEALKAHGIDIMDFWEKK